MDPDTIYAKPKLQWLDSLPDDKFTVLIDEKKRQMEALRGQVDTLKASRLQKLIKLLAPWA